VSGDPKVSPRIVGEDGKDKSIAPMRFREQFTFWRVCAPPEKIALLIVGGSRQSTLVKDKSCTERLLEPAKDSARTLKRERQL
jgi:hypothetical protein